MATTRASNRVLWRADGPTETVPLSSVVLREIPSGEEAQNRALVEQWLRRNPRVQAAFEAGAADVAASPPRFDALLPAFRGVDQTPELLVVSYAPMRYSEYAAATKAHRALRDPSLIDDPVYRLLVSRSLAGEAIFTTSDGVLTTAIRAGEVDRDSGRLHAIPAFKVRQPEIGDPSLVQNLAEQSRRELGGDAGARVAEMVTGAAERVRVFLVEQHSSPASDGNVAIGMHAKLDLSMGELLRSQASRGVEGNLFPISAEPGQFIHRIQQGLSIPDFEGTISAATLAGSFGAVPEPDEPLLAALVERSLDGDPRLGPRLQALQRSVSARADRDLGDLKQDR